MKKAKNDRLGISAREQAKYQPFMEHIRELRRRLVYIASSVAIGAVAAYAVENHIVSWLLRPAAHQKFIYTSPGGGIDFLFRICLYAGIAVSIPVIVYNLLRYLEPILPRGSSRFIAYGSAASALLAIFGMVFGYFVGLPAALKFLLHQFTTTQIQPLVTIQSYMAFVTVYMLGSALLLQIPLVIIFINRIKPLKPQQLLSKERWIILGAFIASGLMNPTPRILDQLLVAGPMIIMYQFSILIIMYTNRQPRRPKHVAGLLEQDRLTQAERLNKLQALHQSSSQDTRDFTSVQ